MDREFRVIGPPGTGKTTWLSRQVERAVKARGSKSVLVASLTKAAATEVAGRGLPVDSKQIGTLHAHCFRALGNPTIAEGQLKEWNEANPGRKLGSMNIQSLDEPSIEDMGLSEESKLLATYQLERARMKPREAWKSDTLGFAKRWEKWKEDTGYLDFTDLIERCYADVAYPPGRPASLFVDEAQDHDRLELALVRKWGETCLDFVIVGDPDQAIYTWRGADPECFTRGGLPPENRKVLSQSYRVPRAVHACASRWIQKLSKREPAEYTPRDADGSTHIRSERDQKHPEEMLRVATRHVEQGQSVMILSSCSYMLAPTLAHLRAEGIPFANRYRMRRGDWNPIRIPGKADSLSHYLRPSKEFYGEDARLWTWAELHAWLPYFDSSKALMRGSKRGVAALARGASGGMQVAVEDLNNVFSQDMAAFSHGGAMACDARKALSWFMEHTLDSERQGYEYLVRVLYRAARTRELKRGIKDLTDPPKLTVGTIHSVKGGEADVVFLLPDLSFQGMESWHSSGQARDAVIRQFYVGMTRAREVLYLCGRSTGRSVDW